MRTAYRARYGLSVLLAGMLQFMPLLRALVPLESRALPPAAWAWILKLGAGTVALLGSYDAVSGATQIVQPYTVNATVGTTYSRQLTTSGQTAHSWSANTAPLGSSVFPLTPGLWLTNSNGRIGGVPSWAGTSNITINAWENSGNSGATVSAVFLFTITNNGPPPPTAPSITTQPRSQTNYVGANVGFTVAASGTAPLAYQWSFQGTPISAATTNAYNLNTVQLSDSGTYSVVITNVAGAVTSTPALLTVLPKADLAITVTAPAVVNAGATLTYTLTATNQGPSAASNVTVTDSLPPGASFVSATPSASQAGSTITWPVIPSLASGASSTFSIVVLVPASGVLTNIGSISSATYDPANVNNSASILTAIQPQADVAVLAQGPAVVLPGSNLVYSIVITNMGPSTASNIVASDLLPSGASFLSASSGGTASGLNVTWPAIPALASGSAVVFTLTASAPSSGFLTNIASCSTGTPDPVTGNNDGSSAASIVITTIGQQADVAVTSTGPSTVLAGATFSYSVNVTNLGPSTANNVVVSDLLPTGAIFVSASGGATLTANTLTWPGIAALGALSGSSFTVTVTAPAAGVLTNIVSSSSTTYDPFAANNDGSDRASRAVTVVGQQADVATLASGPSTVLAGATYTCTVTVSNLGTSTATNVIVRGNLPSTATFISASGGGTVSGNTLNWPTIPSLANGAATSFSVTLRAPLAGSLSTSFSSTSTTQDPNPANNDGSSPASTLLTAVTPQADLVVICTGPSSVTAGTAIAYSLFITNLGPSVCSNIAVVDALPAGSSFVSASGGGTANGNSVTWPLVPSMSPGASLAFTVTATAPGTGPLTNAASASAATADPNPANNDGSGPASQLVTTVTAGTAQLVLTSHGHALNPQTGLIEEAVGVTNIGSATVAAARINVSGLRSGVALQNATGTNGGIPYVQYNAALNPGQGATVRLEFFVVDRQSFSDTLTAQGVLPASPQTATGTSGISIGRAFADLRNPAAARFVIEFPSVPGQGYVVIYSDDGGRSWLVATPSITASSTSTQWYDDGPPKTAAVPSSVTSRLYRVIASGTP